MRNRAQLEIIFEQVSPAFLEAFFNDTTVNLMLRAGHSMEEIVVQLSREKTAQFKLFMREINRLEAIAPRKVVGADGKVYVYRCPDHLIPEPL